MLNEGSACPADALVDRVKHQIPILAGGKLVLIELASHTAHGMHPILRIPCLLNGTLLNEARSQKNFCHLLPGDDRPPILALQATGVLAKPPKFATKGLHSVR
jgi:hypothetical protein